MRTSAALLALMTVFVPAVTRGEVARAEVADRTVAAWEMNEAAGARVMIDGSGHGLHGSIGSEIAAGVSGGGARGYRFSRLAPNTPPPHPRHLVTVADYAALDPGSRSYAVTVRIRTTHHFGNVIQKGQATVAGGNFKFQIPNGVMQCFFRGSAGSAMVQSDHALNDGDWHTVRCERTRTQVSMTVDGVVVSRRGARTGTIANSWPLSIGGKTSCDQVRVSCDYYAGDIDRVQIDVR